MNHTVKEVLQFIRENDVQFVRLAFCDLFGQQKNISLMPDELPAAFEKGVSFDARAVRGFRGAVRSDLLLFPDPSTLTVLPWRPGPGRVVRFYCDIKKPDGSVFAHDSRYLLKQAAERCVNLGYVCKIGAACEFYLFQTDGNGEPSEEPLDRGSYLDISPLDKGENIRREICLCLKDMGINPETSHHEQGPGQNEIDFVFSDALSCADNLITFKSVVKAIAARGGLFASFLPSPLPGRPGSGLHLNVSLSRNGTNIFKNAPGEHSAAAESFIAGVLEKVPEMTLFLNPIANSYERLGTSEAPGFVSWSHQDRSQLIRIPAAEGERVRMELRSPDPSLNPYLAYALVIAAGLDGIEKALELPRETDLDLYTASEADTRHLTPLPRSLDEAIDLAKNSAFVKRVIGEEVLQIYLEEKRKEADDFRTASDRTGFYKDRYFALI